MQDDLEDCLHKLHIRLGLLCLTVAHTVIFSAYPEALYMFFERRLILKIFVKLEASLLDLRCGLGTTLRLKDPQSLV